MGHVWLIGMMGVGKTTVAAVVAERLELPLSDTDVLVMERSGRTIPDLFEDGEEAFRSLERSVVTELARGRAQVVATGGGVVLDASNVEAMRESGATVLLTADIDTLIERLGETRDRPLYGGRGALEEIERNRATAYIGAADHVIDTTGRSSFDVAEEVIRCVLT